MNEPAKLRQKRADGDDGRDDFQGHDKGGSGPDSCPAPGLFPLAPSESNECAMLWSVSRGNDGR